MTAQDRELSRMRSSFLEVAALQLAPSSPAAAAFLQSEKARLHLAQESSKDNVNSRLSACQRCGFTLLPTLTESSGRNHISKHKSKSTGQNVLIYSCKTCGAKTRQKVVSRERSRAARSKDVAVTNAPAQVTEAPTQAPVQSSITTPKPAIARRPQPKKAKSLRAQLAASNISRTPTNASSSSGPGLGLMDFLKQA